MKKYRAYLIGLFILINFDSVKADSPLTYIDFYKAYENEEIIKKALSAKGKLNNELIKYLLNVKNPIDFKMALINSLGWSRESKNNSEILLDYMRYHNKYKTLYEFMENGKDYELICYAYILAQDNYFDVKNALEISKKALLKNNNSYTYNIITNLILSQTYINSNWCNVYYTIFKVNNNKNLKKDFREQASYIIYNYIDKYKDNCK